MATTSDPYNMAAAKEMIAIVPEVSHIAALNPGFKQGDLLSSFFFILIMESLRLSFTRVVNA
nr:hypothetical protein [Tanacetum cinerariifolium]